MPAIPGQMRRAAPDLGIVTGKIADLPVRNWKPDHYLIGAARPGVTLVDFGEAPAAGVLVLVADLSTFVGIGVVSPALSAAPTVAVVLTAPASARCCDTLWVESPLRGLAV
jgi:hypothetical protein